MPKILRGIAVPPFSDNPEDFADLGVEVEQAGFDGYFLWDHMVFSNSGDGPPILDPWLILAVVATRTSKIKIGTMVTPVPRRRPWQLAKETATLDRFSAGRVILGVGIGSPSYGDFGLFGDPSGERERADLLDEGLDIMAGLWSGERFGYQGEKYKIDPVRFAPAPVQQPRIPVWVAGILPNRRPIERAARWDGFVPIRYDSTGLARPSAADFTEVGARIADQRGNLAGYDLAVWAEVAKQPAEEIGAYEQAGATWWIETARPEPDWWPGIKNRVAAGV
ncbi:MAG TPA: LLM class flavin-dependent oxidoreductase [Streptosporangiaceae bacterium]|nr:LLM class flavin-dependent oxidoreductase [Streptosporangiaceae bacterium]